MRVGRGAWYVVRGLGFTTVILSTCLPVHLSAQSHLTIFNAGSLGRPLREALDSFAAGHPGVETAQENAGSLESARKLTELGKIPEVIAVADEAVFPALLMPSQVTWYASFARNQIVLAYTGRSAGAREITAANWSSILLRDGVRTGRSDPALDPNGYRTLMVLQLEERRAKRPGLAARLLAAMPERYLRPKEADLVALLQAGELDYAWSYRSVARTAGLKWIDLPPEVDLSDPARAALYASVSVEVPRGGTDPAPLTIHGAPILYALAIPTAAADTAAARAFVTWLFGPTGRALLVRNGFVVLDHPLLRGDAPPWLQALAH